MAAAAVKGGAPTPSPAASVAPAAAPAQERFVPQMPTVAPEPAAVQTELECCGNCPSWHQTNRKGPFGQCLQAIKWLGAPLYTPDLAGCSLPPEVKAKGR